MPNTKKDQQDTAQKPSPIEVLDRRVMEIEVNADKIFKNLIARIEALEQRIDYLDRYNPTKTK